MLECKDSDVNTQHFYMACYKIISQVRNSHSGEPGEIFSLIGERRTVPYSL
jgi:hypothetical protein